MRILVIGSGAREHAIIKSLIRTGTPSENIVCAPGNEGIAKEVETRDVDQVDRLEVVKLALEERVDLVVIGPEAPLVAGVADALREQGVAVFGPNQDAAQLEGSKNFAKEVMAAADVPTGMAHQCTTMEEVENALDQFGAPYVVKADGLAAGKGVIVTGDRSAALEHAGAYISGGVLVEEFLEGREVSLFFLADGKSVMPLSPAQDYKRAFEGDEGPNTGGMGAYSPLPWAPGDLVDEVTAKVLQPMVDAMAARGAPFSGLLYAGLALTSRGLRVVEFNARFGDPETQVVLARLRSGLGGLLTAAATGSLGTHPEPQWSEDAAVTVVVAAHGYPESPRKGDLISGLDEAGRQAGVDILHAGTSVMEDGSVTSSGGRVLSVTAVGSTLHEARERAYAAVDLITLEGSHHRRDIAARAATSAAG